MSVPQRTDVAALFLPRPHVRIQSLGIGVCCRIKDIHDVVVEGLSRHSLHLLLQPVEAGRVNVATRYAELPVRSFLASGKSHDSRRNPWLL